MKLTTTARHFDSSAELQDHITERLLRFKRYFEGILNVDVIMEVEKFRHIAEVHVHVNGHDFTAKEESEDMYTSIDEAAKSLERQIKKFKGKIIATHHKPRKSTRLLVQAETVFDSKSVDSDGGLEMIEQYALEIPDMVLEEAITTMTGGQENFLLFNNVKTGKLSLVYKRPDGHYGVIGPAAGEAD
ncbi:MAG: ribosome-associated translation inhibitor RaiA [Candidatus Krumholzibacteriota bacterium]|nr:ribosome-associated translation inhibitor RaiA [Candidatus Krumholzibacteriota bacterium]